MATNIQFGTYTPPPPPEGTFDIAIGVFFDGTLNNKTNTDERKKNTEAYKDYGEDPDDNNSYNNDWSNVARLWDAYDINSSVYVEGIGTLDKQADVNDGFMYGEKDTGIVAKVKLGSERIAKRAMKIKTKKGPDFEINTLTIDVFGFSRGAAAVMYQTCGFIKIKSQYIDNQHKIKNNFNNRGDQLVVFVIFNALN